MMTDKQQELFQKMLAGKIIIIANAITGECIFLTAEDGDYYGIVSMHSTNKWDDYVKAWEAYKQVPLVKALG